MEFKLNDQLSLDDVDMEHLKAVNFFRLSGPYHTRNIVLDDRPSIEEFLYKINNMQKFKATI